MAWTHFTAPLEDGAGLTPEMIAEVIAALDERLSTLNAGWGVESAADEEVDLRASGLITHRVYYTGPAVIGVGTVTNTLAQLHDIVARVSREFLRPRFIEAGLGTAGAYTGSAVFADAEAELGLPSGASSSITSFGGESRHYWNLMRCALQLCRWLGLQASGGVAREKFGSTDAAGVAGLAAALAEYVADTEGVVGGAGASAYQTLLALDSPSWPLSPWYQLYGRRAVGRNLIVPSSGAWANGWTLAVRPEWESIGTHLYVPIDGLLEVAGTEIGLPAPSSVGLASWQIGSDVIAATGTVPVDYRLMGYDDGACFADLDAVPWVSDPDAPGDSTKGAACRISTFAGAGCPEWGYGADSD